MNLGMTIHTTFVESENVESCYGLMATQHMHMALLAQLVCARGQEIHVVGTVGRMTGEAVLPHRCMLPQHRTPLVRMALITELIRVAGLKHFGALSSVRIMTGDTVDLHQPILGPE